MAQADLSVIVPALGNEPALRQILENIDFTLAAAGISHEIIVVTEPGYGRAVRRGIKMSSGEWFTVMTADGADIPTDLVVMWEKGRDPSVIAVFGARTIWDGYHPGKYLLNRLGNYVAALVAGDLSYRDWTNPFKLYRREVAEVATHATSPGMSFGMDLAIRVGRKHRFSVVPISWVGDRSGKKSNLGLHSVVGYAMTLLGLVLGRALGRI